MQCHKSSITLISKITDDVYVLTHPKPPTVISCHNHTTPIPPEAYSSPGAIKVNIPCHCRLIINNEEMIPTRFPCLDSQPHEASFIHIIPAAWSNLRSFVLNPKLAQSPQYLNISESLNSNWTLNIPHLNLSTADDNIHEVLDSVKENVKYIYSSTYGPFNDSILIVWNVIISILLAYLLFRQHPNWAIAPNLANLVRADSLIPSEHDIRFGLLCLAFILFVLYLVIKSCLLLRHRHPRRPENEEVNNLPPPPKELQCIQDNGSNQYVIEIGPEILNLPPGQSIRCSLQSIIAHEDVGGQKIST